MSILSDAWRRARGEQDAITRALGAPPLQSEHRTPWVPWLLCCLLLVMVVGLSVYLWRSHGLAHPATQPARNGSAKTPVQPTAASGQAKVEASDAPQTSHAAAAPGHASGNPRTVSAKAASHAAATARAGVASVAPETAPESVRAQLPALAVTVHVWNPQPASRFIVLNGHIYHEGDELMPGLRLVSITRDGEIVNFKGYLITLNGH